MARVKKRRLSRSIYGDAFSIIIMALMAAFMALPLIYAFSNAFKPLDERFLFPPTFIVRNPTFQNFTDLTYLLSTSWVPFSRYLFNSVVITVFGTVGHIFIATTGAYVLAKHKFPGRNIFFALIIASLMFAPQVVSIPNYLIMTGLKLIDSPLSIIIPAWGYSLGLFLMKQFIEQMVPDSFVEAARIDGSSELHTVMTIIMPIVKPAWLTLIIFSVQALWNNTGNLFIFSEQKKTLPYALNQIIMGGIARAGVGAAVSVILMLVPIAIFIFSQSRIVETMAASGIKE